MRQPFGSVSLFILATLLVAVGRRLHEEDAARRPPDAAAASGDDRLAPTKPPAPAEPVREPPVTPTAPIAEDRMAAGDSSTRSTGTRRSGRSFFGLRPDSTSRREAQRILDGNAEVLKKYATWVITVEGHCDERGTAEYNLALGRAPRRWRPGRIWCRSASRPTGFAR